MKHLRYLWYVLRHRWYVFVECCRLGIIWRGLTHDLSKFRPSEWFAYTEFFYGVAIEILHEVDGKIDTTEAEQVFAARKVAFNLAWLKHIHRNPHHWQNWRLRKDNGSTKLIPMPSKYVKEMLADWRGAGKAQGFEEIGPWYEKRWRNIDLATETRDLLHSLMEPNELPPTETVEVFDRFSVDSVSIMQDGNMQVSGKVESSHMEERFIGSPGQGVSIGSLGGRRTGKDPEEAA